MDRGEIRVKKNWSEDEAVVLLEYFIAREAEFQRMGAKQYAYADLLEDMISLGLVKSDTRTLHLEAKMSGLLKSYKSARTNNTRTGVAPCVAPFVEQMNEIFGSKRITSNVHTARSRALGMEPVHENASPSGLLGSNIERPSGSDFADVTPSPNPAASFSGSYFSPEAARNYLPPPSGKGSERPSSLRPSKSKGARDIYMEKLMQQGRMPAAKDHHWEEYLRLQKEQAKKHRNEMSELNRMLEKM